MSLVSSSLSLKYVAVYYQDSTVPTLFEYGKCYPYEINEKLAQFAVFCRPATCYDNPYVSFILNLHFLDSLLYYRNPDCTGGAVPPVGIPIPAGLPLPNVADWVQLLGQGATCWRNRLPGLP